MNKVKKQNKYISVKGKIKNAKSDQILTWDACNVKGSKLKVKSIDLNVTAGDAAVLRVEYYNTDIKVQKNIVRYFPVQKINIKARNIYSNSPFSICHAG